MIEEQIDSERFRQLSEHAQETLKMNMNIAVCESEWSYGQLIYKFNCSKTLVRELVFKNGDDFKEWAESEDRLNPANIEFA